MRDDQSHNEETPSLVSIHTLGNRFEADFLISALEQEGIHAFIRSFEETPYDGLFVPQRGWGLIMVTEDLAERARDVIQPLVREIQSKNLYVDPGGVDPQLWETLNQVDPELISINAQVKYDSERAAYIIPFLDETFLCYPERESIEAVRPSPYHKLNFEMYLAMLHYLLEAKNAGLSGKWISEKDIPGGQLFFRGPHKFPTDSLLSIFGSQSDIFSAASEQIGGTRVNMGDVAYRFWAFPRVPLLFVFWEGDDEFEPNLRIRFDDTVNLHLRTLDTIWALVNVVCTSLRASAKAFKQTKSHEQSP